MEIPTLKIYSGETPTYCSSCGRKLVVKTHFYSYDQKTGEKLYGYTLKCPIFISFLQGHISFLQGHTNHDFSPTGGEIISYNY